MKLTRGQTDFLALCLKLHIVNPVPVAVKLGFPEAEVREYFLKRNMDVSQEGWLSSTKSYLKPNQKKSGKSKLRIGKATGSFPRAKK